MTSPKKKNKKNSDTPKDTPNATKPDNTNKTAQTKDKDNDSTVFNTRYELMAGALSGIVSGSILSPFDKALYFSIKYHRPLFVAANWKRPFHGISQTLLYRTLSQTIYFPCEKMCKHYMSSYKLNRKYKQTIAIDKIGNKRINRKVIEPYILHPKLKISTNTENNIENFLCGTIAGSLTAISLNPTQVIRYDCWINHTTFWQSLKNLYIGGGMRNFSKGLIATLYRDALFGSIYSMTRHLEPNKKWNVVNDKNYQKYQYFWDGTWNAICAFAATAVSSPFNYVRSIQFATPSHTKPDTIRYLARQMVRDLKSNEMTLSEKYYYLNVRLKIGWGTARVALGMAMGSQLYSFFVHRFETRV